MTLIDRTNWQQLCTVNRNRRSRRRERSVRRRQLSNHPIQIGEEKTFVTASIVLFDIERFAVM